MAYNSYESFKACRVEADSVEDFLQKYTQYSRHEGRGDDYAQHRVKTYQAEYDKHGYCMMSRHESNTGHVVAYYGQAEEKVEGQATLF